MVNVPWCHECDRPDGICTCRPTEVSAPLTEDDISVTIAEMDEATRDYYRDPNNRKRLRERIESNYVKDGGPLQVKLADGTLLKGEAAELVFGLRECLLRVLAAFPE